MGALSFSETIDKLSEYRHGDRECVEDDNTIKIDCHTLAYAEYWLRYAYEKGHLVEIVRCKDCKHYDETQRGTQRAEKRRYVCDDFNPPDDWFCADGERRTDDA